MTKEERDAIRAEAEDRADTKNRIANLEKQVKVVLVAAYGAAAWAGTKVLEFLFSTNGGGQP